MVLICVFAAPADFHVIIRWMGCSRFYAGADSWAIFG